MSIVVTVRSLLEGGPLRGATVIGGAHATDRLVTAVRAATTAVELDKLAADAAPGELLVVDRSAVDPEPGWRQIAAQLATAPLAGVVVTSPGPWSARDRREPETRLAASTIPWLAATADHPRDVEASILAALLDRQTRRLARVLEINDRIATSTVAGGGAREIAEALHALIGHPIVIVDGTGRTTAAVPDGTVVPDRTGVVRHPVRAHGGEDDGAVIAVVDRAALDPDAWVALERAATAIAMRHAQARALAASQERFAAFALEELVSGHAADREELADRAASLGWNLDIPRAVLLASIDPPTDPRTANRTLGTIAAAARSVLGRDAIVWTRSTTVAALIAPDTDSVEDRRRLALALQHELDERVHGVTISIGVGRRVADPLDLPTSFVQARRAVDVGRWAKGRHVTEVFDELGLERLLAAVPAEELTAFVRHTLGPLQEHDARHRGDLLATLEAWLETRNVAEAARRTFVHYNTFKNRLDRIEQILGPITTDPAKSLEYGVALHIARHHETGAGVSLGDPSEP